MRRRWLVLFFGGLLLAAPVQAQTLDVLSGLFDSVNSIAFSAGGGAVLGESAIDPTCFDIGLCGMALEVFLDLPSPEAVDLELGLGTSFLRGFAASEPSLDLRGSVRTLPFISVYLTRLGTLGERWPVQPYAGLNFGYAQLWNARGYDADGVQYEVGGEAFEVGATAGVFVNVGGASGLFLEASLRQRRFDSLDWSLPGGVLPDGWPRDLNASTLFVNVGWQFWIERAES